jgi:uncharacterized protein (DUF2237 family)
MPDASGSDPGRRRDTPKNVFGETLDECCTTPLTGFYRDGSCNTGPEDFGVHTVCARVDVDFLAFSKAAGNDLSTPVPQVGFAGLKPGDCWCLCAARWKEAFDAGHAPRIRLAATHEATLDIVPFDTLKKYALDIS